MTKTVLILTILVGVFTATPSNAEINIFEGIEFSEIEVGGESVRFPVGNTERKQDIYFLKLALNGDKTAREMFLGGKKERWFFIGTETPLWLKVTEFDEEIIKP